ncbi:1-aminocyclopropane-1-carboxylate deaminase/D-cysteine desulfhydrase [Christiangramia forsetii]|uniref:1-aminocyclopropane-1-carboxylate deaminase n=2 Tax=Christiangramia forsetii TaxID=411153 RepID=A0LXY1_CHRFK|nr:pyridoxal-phosphate dependent enzyme [Christiangramia forsetii]GGG35508.1 1-aminocyclopropane-1-carboxylate deaminase [Christiangramia forsetii]CAL65226.1 1-aminocyclopropane-1-carboxylate deaminase [Christiangramia forsetii KT0803]
MQDFFEKVTSESIPNEFITEFPGGIKLWIKREDLLHPEVSGNKFRKLKYNLLQAKKENHARILTFGGAHSNHISATATAGQLLGFKTIGIIRGEELVNSQEKWSPTLKYAASCGMKFEFISREKYRNKDSEGFLQKLKLKFDKFYQVPEGGTNELAIKGCEEILSEKDKDFNYICASVGTGGTIAGLINSSEEDQKVLGFSALNSDYLKNEVSTLVNKGNWEIILNYHFGGYAKVNAELIDFMNDFSKKYKIILDPLYTGKLVFGIFDLVKCGYFPENSKILAIHTGGLQGIEGMNRFLKRKDLPQIIY